MQLGFAEIVAVIEMIGEHRAVRAVAGWLGLGMIGAAYASVPLYKAFCQITGFDGTVRKAEVAPDKVLARKITVHFDANSRDLPWTFTAMQNAQDVKIGETKLAFFKVTNHSDKPVTARAVFNVVPEQAGAYFQKLQCFCFNQYTLEAGEKKSWPVVFVIDPKLSKDVKTITLSYTFFEVGGKTPPAPVANVQGRGVTGAGA